MTLTKKQLTRIRRVMNNFRGPMNHLNKDGLDKIFADEIEKLQEIIDSIREKANQMGYDPEEEFTDVNKESYYRE